MMFLQDGLAWMAIIGLAAIAFVLIGNSIVVLRRYAKQIDRTVDAD